MVIVHLMASPFFGGPERQMVGLAQSLPAEYRSVFLTFAERGLCRALLREVKAAGFQGIELQHNFPHIRVAANEVARHLRRVRADVVCCSGYKPDVIGWLAARQVGVPVVSVSHGWTAATFKVRCYEAINRFILRWMDAIVCVSERQAGRVRRAGVTEERIVVIRNAVHLEPFAEPDPAYRAKLHGFFTAPRSRIIGAAGRLSPEKGFDQLIAAAALVVKEDPQTGFVIFGDGKLRQELERDIAERRLEQNVVLAGFRTDVERFLPHLDLAVLSSHTEGLPVIVLEALAARVPVVATAVGGVPEVIEDGLSGYLVPPGDPAALARRIQDALRVESVRLAMGQRGRQRVAHEFSFAEQSAQYQRLLARLTRSVRGKRQVSAAAIAIL